MKSFRQQFITSGARQTISNLKETLIDVGIISENDELWDFSLALVSLYDYSLESVSPTKYQLELFIAIHNECKKSDSKMTISDIEYWSDKLYDESVPGVFIQFIQHLSDIKEHSPMLRLSDSYASLRNVHNTKRLNSTDWLDYKSEQEFIMTGHTNTINKIPLALQPKMINATRNGSFKLKANMSKISGGQIVDTDLLVQRSHGKVLVTDPTYTRLSANVEQQILDDIESSIGEASFNKFIHDEWYCAMDYKDHNLAKSARIQLYNIENDRLSITIDAPAEEKEKWIGRSVNLVSGSILQPSKKDYRFNTAFRLNPKLAFSIKEKAKGI